MSATRNWPGGYELEVDTVKKITKHVGGLLLPVAVIGAFAAVAYVLRDKVKSTALAVKVAIAGRQEAAKDKVNTAGVAVGAAGDAVVEQSTLADVALVQEPAVQVVDSAPTAQEPVAQVAGSAAEATVS